MNELLPLAQAQLREGHYTCVLTDGHTVLIATDRGIKPLRNWLQSERKFQDFVAADRVVGKAAAFLYVLMGVRAVYAEIVSAPAAAVLRRDGMDLSYGTRVDAIRNRTGDGFCPMESAVWSIDSPEEALTAIEKTYQTLTKKEVL